MTRFTAFAFVALVGALACKSPTAFTDDGGVTGGDDGSTRPDASTGNFDGGPRADALQRPDASLDPPFSIDGGRLPDGGLIDAPGVDGSVGLACNPLTQQGCQSGDKCGWIVDQDMPPVGHIGCSPPGIAAVDQACTLENGTTGASNCVQGAECIRGVCRAMCDPFDGFPTCDAQHGCNTYTDMLEAGDQPVAGLCDVRCDPLTQAAALAPTVACGSPTPATPTLGCYPSGKHRVALRVHVRADPARREGTHGSRSFARQRHHHERL